MIDYDDMIYRGNNKLYMVNCDYCDNRVGYRPRSSTKAHKCGNCRAKERIQKYPNPMQGKRHVNREKFRKNTHFNMDYEDTITTVSKSNNKKIKYRKTCPICKKDMGYHINSDAFRKCIKCQGDINRKTTPIHRRLKASMKANIASRLKMRNASKNRKSTFDIVEYTVDELKSHLESLFTEGMSWENYGEWHIDHIRPDSWFDYSSYNDKGFKESWALSNLQPLWAKDNLSKSNKYEG